MTVESSASLEASLHCHGLRFVRVADAEHYRRNGLPGSEAAAVYADKYIAQQLVAPANDRISGIVLIGWAPAAVPLILADPYLTQKRIAWIVRPSDLRGMAAAFTGTSLATQASVLPCQNPDQLPYLLEFAAYYWTHVVLDPDWVSPAVVEQISRYRTQRAEAGPIRKFPELANTLHRAKRLSDTIALSTWYQAYAGHTAFCLAAGPSLDRRMDFLRAHQERCVVIAVDVICERLQRDGIKVDFVLTVDPAERLHNRLRPTADTGTVLIMPLSGHASLDAKFPNRSCWMPAMVAEKLGLERANFLHGSTVGITSVGFASYLGCTEVILLGHDLGYDGDNYYSSAVADKDKALEFENKKNDPFKIEVKGNNGKTIVSNTFFETAIHDLGMMLEQLSVSVFNPNINDRTGAHIAKVEALPTGWHPASESKLSRPLAVTQVVRPRNYPGLADDIRANLAVLLDHWRSSLGQGQDPVEIHMAARKMNGLALSYFDDAVQAGIRHHLRWLTKPFFSESQRSATLTYLRTCIEAGAETITQFLANPDVLWGADVEDKVVRQFFRGGLPAMLAGHTGSADQIMLPSLMSSYSYARQLIPEAGLPCPLSGNDGLMIGNQMPVCPSRQFALETICLCVLENDGRYDEILPWARESGLLSTLDGDLPAEPNCLGATAAVLRLRNKASTSIKVDASFALTWPPSTAHAVSALAQWSGEAHDVLQQMLMEGSAVLDDAACAQVMLHFPDYRQAAHLLKPYAVVFGEATQIALAQRECEAGRHRESLQLVSSLRRLSTLRDQALIIACECHVALRDAASARTCASELCDDHLAQHWQYRLDVATGDTASFIQRLSADPALPDVGVMAECAKLSITTRSIATAQALADSIHRHGDKASPPHRQLLEALNRFLTTAVRRT
jgi:hypothetical protein